MNTRSKLGSMTVTNRGFASRFSSLAVLALGAAAAASCVDQPEVQCFGALSTGAPFTVSYELVEVVEPGDDETLCNGLKVDSVGVQTYVTNPNKKPGRNSVALQTLQMGNWMFMGRYYRVPGVDADWDGVPEPDAENPLDENDGLPTSYVASPVLDEDHTLYGLGKFSSKHPNSKDICEVPKLSPAQLVLPALDEFPTAWDDELPTLATDDEEQDPDGLRDIVPAQPAVDVTAAWSNVKFYVTPGDTGTQFGADLTYTLNGCTAKYRALGVNVSSTCKTDADCTVKALKAQNLSASDTYPNLKCLESSEPDPSAPGDFKKLCALTGSFPQLR
jgi:hypothetical protein